MAPGTWGLVADVDDVAFAKALVAQIQETASIDPKRICAVDFSMGGGMFHHLACHPADVFAAVAPAAFELLEQNAGDFAPPRDITRIPFRGTFDPIVPYASRSCSLVSRMPVTFLGVRARFERWADINQCTGSPSAEGSQGSSTYSSCQGDVEVVLCTKQGGGHEAGNASVGWSVLRRHTFYHSPRLVAGRTDSGLIRAVRGRGRWEDAVVRAPCPPGPYSIKIVSPAHGAE